MAWIGVDLDGTLAFYNGWKGETEIGPPVPRMVERVKGWLAEGKEVRIVTARVAHAARNLDGTLHDPSAVVRAIQAWCLEHIGQMLPVTNAKDFGMIELWDDRAVQVIPNTGIPVDPRVR
jgi:hypothetical protein